MSSLIDLLLEYRYVALVPLAFLEGPGLAVAIGFLLYTGKLAFVPSFGILIFADAARDVLSYWVGHTGHAALAKTKFGSRLLSIERLWIQHTWKAVMLSKWAYGLNFPMLVSAGLARVSFRRFFSIAMAVTGIQYALLITVGFFFGHSQSLIGEYLFFSQVVVAVFVLLVIATLALVSWRARRLVESQ